MISSKFIFDASLAIARRGLQNGGRVQQVIDSEVLRRVNPYTPRREGILISSGTMHTKLGSGNVIQSAPYARRLYYNPQYNFSEAPRRGAYWFERMKADQKDDILRTAATESGGRPKK